MREREYQARLIRHLRELFPGCVILKNDPDYLQGIPDLLLLYGTYWAMLEVKRRAPRGPEDFEPNQEWYLEQLNHMSFASCIYPENEEEVLYALQQAFESHRPARLS